MQFKNPFAKDDSAPAKPAKRARGGGAFFDDSQDGYRNAPRNYDMDAAENGEVDLANVGGVYYLAFIPFLLFAFSYLGGAMSSPYSKGGNF